MPRFISIDAIIKNLENLISTVLGVFFFFFFFAPKGFSMGMFVQTRKYLKLYTIVK